MSELIMKYGTVSMVWIFACIEACLFILRFMYNFSQAGISALFYYIYSFIVIIVNT